MKAARRNPESRQRALCDGSSGMIYGKGSKSHQPSQKAKADAVLKVSSPQFSVLVEKAAFNYESILKTWSLQRETLSASPRF
jgi:predicted rRNA methylase YqxC with S4 and FtsJ domains